MPRRRLILGSDTRFISTDGCRRGRQGYDNDGGAWKKFSIRGMS